MFLNTRVLPAGIKKIAGIIGKSGRQFIAGAQGQQF
jgi:hypothetical protein